MKVLQFSAPAPSNVKRNAWGARIADDKKLAIIKSAGGMKTGKRRPSLVRMPWYEGDRYPWEPVNSVETDEN